MEVDISLRRALYWMNIYSELLGVDERALRQIRAFGAGDSGPQMAEVRVIVTEIARVRDRLEYWDEIVDQANGRLGQPAC